MVLNCTKSIDFNAQQIQNSLAITPYFGIGGENRDETGVHYPHLVGYGRNTYPIYLIKCIYGLKKYFTDIVVSCQNEKDLQDLNSIRTIFGLDFNILYLDCVSYNLPITTLKHMQDTSVYKNYKYLYYTECDQIPYISDSIIKNVGNLLDRDTVLSFHRLVRKYLDNDITAKQFQTDLVVEFDNLQYYVCCLSHAVDFDSTFTVHTDEGGAYGAAYLCTAECFSQVDYKFSSSCPCEYASHSVYQSNKLMLKTKNVMHAFVVHLSGLNESLKLNNLDISILPNLW